MTDVSARIYSVGYTGFPYDSLIAFVQQRPRMILADVRLKPFSRFHPHWNRSQLQAALGAQYEWVEPLGNVNYRGGPILLKDLPAGIDRLRRLLESHDLAVMCACQDPARCHRTSVTTRLEADGYAIEHVSAKGPQRPLF